jgi:hypothetical protein
MHGLDSAVAPPANVAKAMLEQIGGSWWNVYIGGPRATNAWKPAEVESYRAAGIVHFLLTYVGRQQDDVALLTSAQGDKDGEAAVRLAATFGFGAGEPLALDLEQRTFNAAPSRSLDYIEGWVASVRRQGWRPGVYTNVGPLNGLAERAEKPDFVWVARFVRDAFDPTIDHRRIKGLPDDLWAGRRAWQYVGDTTLPGFGHKIDIDVTDASSGCLTGTTPGAGLLKAASLMEEDDMFTFTTAGKPVFFVAGGKAVGLNSANDVVAIKRAVPSLPEFKLDAETFNEFLRVYRS